MSNLLKKRVLVLLSVLLLVVPLMIVGCSNSSELSITDASSARDAVLDYLDNKCNDNIPGQNLPWREENRTPSGVSGLAIKSYTSEEWTMLISYPVVKPDLTIYTVTLVNNNTGWKWEGNVSANGIVNETRPLSQITQEESRQIAEDFVKNSPTFKFDGILGTLKLVETLYPDIENAWQFVFQFESANAGYGDRTGQMVAEVITPHEAIITLEKGKIKNAIMDEKWDMINQRMLNDVEISLAPIHEVEIYFMKSFPVQVGVHIIGGLRDGCTNFHDVAVTREENTIDVEVTVRKPKGMTCPAIYTFFEENLNLGSDFTVGDTYTLKVNDYTTTFVY
jgi:hypothetical protein